MTRNMIGTSKLLNELEFRERLHLSERRLRHLLAVGSVFAIEVDDAPYFPELFTASDIDQRRLHSICRILVPAPPACRLDYLTSRRSNLGGIKPVEALQDDKLYRLARRMASAYAVEWERTSVSIFAGRHEEVPEHIEAILVAACEIDSRKSVWKRADKALRDGGYVSPDGPYPSVSTATVFVARHRASEATAIPELRMDVRIDAGCAKASVFFATLQRKELDAVDVAGAGDINEVVLKILASGLKKRASV